VIIGGWWVESELDAQQGELMTLEVVDRNSAETLQQLGSFWQRPSLSAAFSSRSRGMTLVRRRSCFKAVLGKIRGPHPDAVTNWHLMDGKEGLSVLLKAGNRDREAVLVAVGKPIDSGTGGIEGGSIAHRREMRHDLWGLLIGKLCF